MKKTIIICFIVFFLFSFINKQEDEQIRIRIIANSNNIVDQNYKNEVVEYLYINYNLSFCSLEECDDYLTNNICIIKSDLESTFNNLHVSYEYHNFYNKAYNNIVSENKEYKTLLIEINNALGDNFWGVLFSSNHVECEETIIYNSYIKELFKKGDLNV